MRMLITNQSKITRSTLLAPICRAMPFFSSRSEKKFVDVDTVVKKKHKNLKIEIWLLWSVLLSTTSTRHYSLFLHVERVSKRF